MKRTGWLILLLTLAAQPGLAQRLTRETEEGSWFELRLNALAFDNLFQAPEGAPQEDVYGGQVEGRFEVPFGGNGAGTRWTGFGRASYSDYDSGLDPSQSVGVGVKGGSRRHRIELFAEYANNRPSIELDEFDQADVARFVGDYDFRFVDDWQVSLIGTVEQQGYARAAERDNDFWAGALAVRYRGFGRGFSPEIGYGVGARDVDNPSQSYDQSELWARVISEPVEALYLAFRYRLREREYTIGDPTASNFGRDDDRAQWSATATYRSGEHLLWNLYWARESSDSSRPGVDFTTQVLALGAGWRF